MPPQPVKRQISKPLAAGATITVASLAALAAWLGGVGSSAPKVTVAPTITPLTATTNEKVYSFNFTQVPNATAYQLWLDGVPFSVVPAQVFTGAPVLTQSRLVPLVCGIKHRINVKGISGSSVGPLGIPQYVTVPAC